VISRRELGHHPAIVSVHGHLGMQGVRKQPAACLVQGNAGFIAGRFNTQDQHSILHPLNDFTVSHALTVSNVTGPGIALMW